LVLGKNCGGVKFRWKWIGMSTTGIFKVFSLFFTLFQNYINLLYTTEHILDIRIRLIIGTQSA
jgi:hypothetical protein